MMVNIIMQKLEITSEIMLDQPRFLGRYTPSELLHV